VIEELKAAAHTLFIELNFVSARTPMISAESGRPGEGCGSVKKIMLLGWGRRAYPLPIATQRTGELES